MPSQAQNSFYEAETFDLGMVPVTYTAAGLGSAKYTAGVAYYSRLDPGALSFIDGYISALWSPGSGTAPTAYFGLYAAVPGTSGESNGSLYQLGATANVGASAAGVIRAALEVVGSTSTALGDLGFPASGNPIGGVQSGSLYAALLVKTDAGTNHVDVATSTAFAANTIPNADPTGQGGWPRAFHGAGSSLTALPLSEAISGITAVNLIPWLAID